MKKILLLLVLFSSGSSMAAFTTTALDPFHPGSNTGDGSHLLIVKLVSPSVQQQMEFSFNSEQALLDFDPATIVFIPALEEGVMPDCQVSITVTVRIGLDSNFVQASATVSGISCSQVTSTIRRLRQELLSAIK